MSDPSPSPRPVQIGRLSVWLLGILSVFGLIGFVVAFGLIAARTVPPLQAAAPAQPAGTSQPGPPGERGPPGPPGPRGPSGDAGVRIVRSDCPGGNCTIECETSEMLLMAHCGAGRGQATVQSERSALCRAPARTRTEMVAACVKTQ